MNATRYDLRSLSQEDRLLEIKTERSIGQDGDDRLFKLTSGWWYQLGGSSDIYGPFATVRMAGDAYRSI